MKNQKRHRTEAEVDEEEDDEERRNARRKAVAAEQRVAIDNNRGSSSTDARRDEAQVRNEEEDIPGLGNSDAEDEAGDPEAARPESEKSCR